MSRSRSWKALDLNVLFLWRVDCLVLARSLGASLKLSASAREREKKYICIYGSETLVLASRLVAKFG